MSYSQMSPYGKVVVPYFLSMKFEPGCSYCEQDVSTGADIYTFLMSNNKHTGIWACEKHIPNAEENMTKHCEENGCKVVSLGKNVYWALWAERTQPGLFEK